MSADGSSFDDQFSAQAPAYADFRPRYPHGLYAWLASLLPDNARALDCGTGSGQAAVDLARHVGEVVAVDPSSSQIEHAIPHERVRYRVAPAEETGLDDDSVDLVVCATSIHWFDLDRFYAEVHRVLRPGGVIAAWTYQHSQVAPDIDPILSAFATETLAGYWSPKLAHLFDRYRSLPFPFEEIDAPEFAIEGSLTLARMLGFVSSWSATRAYREAREEDPLVALAERLEPLWGSGERVVRWPLSIRVGTIRSESGYDHQ